jgi:hypothetical protein
MSSPVVGENEMANSKHSWATFLILTAVAVCILGLLILPQVDPADFVLNGAKVPKISVVHGKDTSSSGSISKSHSFSNPTRESSQPRSSQSLVESHHALYAPHALLSLRC